MKLSNKIAIIALIFTAIGVISSIYHSIAKKEKPVTKVVNQVTYGENSPNIHDNRKDVIIKYE